MFDALKFVGNFLLVFTYTFLGLFAQDWISKDKLTADNLILSAIISFLLVVITYIRELIVTSSANEKVKHSKLIYECIDGAITKLQEYLSDNSGKHKYYTALLNIAERMTFINLMDYGFVENDFTANLMVYNKNKYDEEELILKYRGTCLAGRVGTRKLSINRDDPSPGAVEAFCSKEVVYLPDISKSPIKEKFGENRPYKSILSIPIPLRSDTVFILNIDSLHAEAFISRDVINKLILPTLEPLLNLFLIKK